MHARGINRCAINNLVVNHTNNWDRCLGFIVQDWLCANIVVVMVLLLNLCLAFLFINLVNNAGKLGPPTTQVAELSPEEKRAAASAAAEAVQKALRAANAASRSAASSVSRPKS